MKKVVVCLAALAVTFGVSSALAANIFVDLGSGKATDMSNDGSLIVGNGGGGGYLWDNGAQSVIGNDAQGVERIGGSVGTVIGGNVGGAAANWTPGAGWQMEQLCEGTYDWKCTHLGAKDDGDNYYMSGYTTSTSCATACRLKQKFSSPTWSTRIGAPSGGHDHSRFFGASDNGRFGGVAQCGGSPCGGGARNPMRANWVWMPVDAGGPSGSVEGESDNVSSDGNVYVGWGWAASGAWQAHYWVHGTDTPNLVPLMAGEDWTEAHAVDGDGNVIGGWQYTDGYSRFEAWIWDNTGGQNSLKTVEQYLNDKGVDTTGWEFNNVTGISDDGTCFCGYGKYLGVEHGWAYTVPEPATLSLLLLGLPMLRRRRS